MGSKVKKDGRAWGNVISHDDFLVPTLTLGTHRLFPQCTQAEKGKVDTGPVLGVRNREAGPGRAPMELRYHCRERGEREEGRG